MIDENGVSEPVIAELGLLLVDNEWLGDCECVSTDDDEVENELVGLPLMVCDVDIVGVMKLVRDKDDWPLNVLDRDDVKERILDPDVDFETAGERL